MTVYGRPHSVILPSGVKVLARRPSIMSLIASGGFPDELTALVWRMGQEKTVASELSQTPEGIRQLATMIEAFLPYVLMSPKVGPVTATELGDDGVLTGTIERMDIDDGDKNWLFLFGQGVILTQEERQAAPKTLTAADLGRFRTELQSSQLGQSGEAVQSTAVEVGGTGPEQPAGA